MKNKKQYKLTVGLMVVYILAVVWIILFKLQLPFADMGHIRSINLIPFGESVIINGRLHILEIVQNILIFVPCGIYISMLKPEWSFIKKAAPAFAVSFVLEMLQFIFAIGATDITDLIGNTLGGIIGIGFFAVYRKIFKDKSVKVMNVIALVATAAMLCLIGLLIIVNL